MDIIEVLIQQHRDVEDLFEAYRPAPDDSSRS